LRLKLRLRNQEQRPYRRSLAARPTRRRRASSAKRCSRARSLSDLCDYRPRVSLARRSGRINNQVTSGALSPCHLSGGFASPACCAVEVTARRRTGVTRMRLRMRRPKSTDRCPFGRQYSRRSAPGGHRLRILADRSLANRILANRSLADRSRSAAEAALSSAKVAAVTVRIFNMTIPLVFWTSLRKPRTRPPRDAPLF
jgi:hypothetical protein